ncbi:hypothetical protein CALCODRAFT_406965, partial [Calocera cornea HHB12733]
MPELPEAERACRLLRESIVGGTIRAVDTVEDTIVYDGVEHGEFAQELKGRQVLAVHRHGKLFWLELSSPPTNSTKSAGTGARHPLFHLGMTGMIQLRGGEPTWYRVRPKDMASWPPRFWKFVMHITPPQDPKDLQETDRGEEIQFAYLDARRLGRIRLRLTPRLSPPVSLLGFDPLLSPLPLSTFSALLLRRQMPIKALLLDQSFSAGVGNWVADEVLFQARVHPERRASGLGEEEVRRVWEKVGEVCRTAVGVNADSSQFPRDWLFRHRWGKGRKSSSPSSSSPLLLPDGTPATIKFITVGGRTSAYVAEVQKL